MSTLLESPGYYDAGMSVTLDEPVSVCVGRVPEPVLAGFPVRIGWLPCSTGAGVEWAELAIGFQIAGHGDPGPTIAGWADISPSLGADHPVYTTIYTTIDIPAGSSLYVTASSSAKAAPGIGGSSAIDDLMSGRIARGTDDGSVYRPSTANGTTTFKTTSAHPIRVSVLLP